MGRLSKWLWLILVFSFLSKLLFLGHPEKEYFDEVYHAFTARRILNGDSKAWEWWNRSPEGFAYEWSHPPLAKLGMTLGMVAFGENSFGWRIPGVILGTGITLLTYLLTKKLFKEEKIALLAAAIISLDGLIFTMSRIGMNDIYFLFFALSSLYFFARKRNFFSSLTLGLAAASKWTVFWFVPVLIFSHLVFKRKLSQSYLWFLILPPLVYLISYLPMFLTGHNFQIFIEVQKQMWWYHTGLKAEHSYGSAWWSWPLMIRPVFAYLGEGEIAQKIYLMGNPIIFWSGLGAVLYGLVYYRKKLGLLIFAYLAFFVPWVMSPRVMFLYHYLPSLPFLSIILAYVLNKKEKLVIPFLALAAVFFFYFLPHLAGLPIPGWLDESYYWLGSWR